MLDDDNAGYGACLTINLDALVANYQLIQRRAAPSKAGAVVKANAYGLGVAQISKTLADHGCTDFFVAHLCEAEPVLRSVGRNARIFLLNGLPKGAEQACAAMGAIPVINSPEQIARWNQLGQRLGKKLPAALQVDSGMGRLGLSPDELTAFHADPAAADHINLVLLMSHLACADAAEAPANSAQRQRFDAITAHFPTVPRSLANSGGVFLGAGFHNDLVRAGIALYGAQPQEGDHNPMQAVVSLTAPIVQIRTVPAGDGIGYGLTASVDHDRRIAVISVGYADGWPRRLGNVGSAYISGVKIPIVGRVSMDSMLLDVTSLDEQACQPGALVELLGPHQSVDEVAKDADTISYEIMTQLGQRYARHYVGGAPDPQSRSEAQ